MDITPEELVADVQEQLNRAKQILSRLQNVTSTGSGSSMPVNLIGGIAVPPVSSVSAVVSSYTPGVAHVVCRWIEPQNTLNVDRYNVYVIGAELGQTQPVLVASSATSPAVFPVHVDATRTVKILVQTVLTNGQVMPVLDCPATALSITGPGSGGSGTVTSVAQTVPSGFTVTGSPITTSGTLAITADSQAANKFYASPSGSSGSPTFRVIATADLPLVSWTGLSFNNSWTDFGSGIQAGQYSIDTSGRVWLRGSIKPGTTALNTTVATLPVGFRPIATRVLYYITLVGSAVVPGQISIYSDGTVVFEGISSGTVSLISLENISFSTL